MITAETAVTLCFLYFPLLLVFACLVVERRGRAATPPEQPTAAATTPAPTPIVNITVYHAEYRCGWFGADDAQAMGRDEEATLSC